MNTAVLADCSAIGGDQFSRNIGKRLALLGEIGVDKILVVAAGHKANLLRVRLLRRGQSMLAGKVTNFRLSHVPQRKHRPAELLLRQPEKKIGLGLRMIGGTLPNPTARVFLQFPPARCPPPNPPSHSFT